MTIKPHPLRTKLRVQPGPMLLVNECPVRRLKIEVLQRHRLQVGRFCMKESFWSIRKDIFVTSVREFLTIFYLISIISVIGNNTGYKQYDHRKPCKKCWSKYAKPFSGPLAYSYSSSATSSNTQNINLQRPLPNLNQNTSPQRSPPQQTNRLLRPPPHHPLSNSRPASYNGMRSSPPGGYLNRGPGIYTTSGFGQLPPGATVYRPGDPRIGGDLCWRCNGKGTMNIFIDIINCPICNGCGRTFISAY
jgi:hypothetical protein